MTKARTAGAKRRARAAQGGIRLPEAQAQVAGMPQWARHMIEPAKTTCGPLKTLGAAAP